MTRLDEYDMDEWWDVCRRVRPDITRAQFELMWAEFVRTKAQAGGAAAATQAPQQ